MQAKSSGISLPEVHGVGKGLDPNILPEKQVIKPIVPSEVMETSQDETKVRSRQSIFKMEKLKLQCLHWLINLMWNLQKNQLEQPKIPFPVKFSEYHDKITPIPDYAIPQTRSGDDSSSRMVKRKTIQKIR